MIVVPAPPPSVLYVVTTMSNKTIQFKKRALSALDDKKFILKNGIETLSYGHYNISRIQGKISRPKDFCFRNGQF